MWKIRGTTVVIYKINQLNKLLKICCSKQIPNLLK